MRWGSTNGSFEAGLNAADGPDEPPTDVAERVQWHTAPGDAGPDGTGGDVDWRAWILDHATHLQTFDPDVFDTTTDSDHARLAAGAMVVAGTIIDELFQDLKPSTTTGASSRGAARTSCWTVFPDISRTATTSASRTGSSSPRSP